MSANGPRGPKHDALGFMAVSLSVIPCAGTVLQETQLSQRDRATFMVS